MIQNINLYMSAIAAQTAGPNGLKFFECLGSNNQAKQILTYFSKVKIKFPWVTSGTSASMD